MERERGVRVWRAFFSAAVVLARGAKSALQLRPHIIPRVHHRSPGVLTVLPPRIRAPFGSTLRNEDESMVPLEV